MLENAVEKGVRVFRQSDVKEVLFDGDKAVGVQVAVEDGESKSVYADIIVDATGQSCLISRRLGLRKKDPHLVKGSIFAHYENGHRDPGIDEGATIILHTRDNKGWFWYIPLSKNRVSVGVVSSPKSLFGDQASPEEVLNREIDNCPAVRERLKDATKSSPAMVLSDFSYRAKQLAGNGWVLVGDALGFLDPIYSSGVFLALKSGEVAAETMDRAIRSGDYSAASLGDFGPDFMRGMEAIRKLVYAFYTPGFSFSGFIREHPEHHDRLVDLLIGDVFKDGVEDFFEDLQAFCELPVEMPLD